MMANATAFTSNTDLACLLCAEPVSPLECESVVHEQRVGRRQRVGTHELAGDGIIVAGVYMGPLYSSVHLRALPNRYAFSIAIN
jgi:hypothetical protein